MTLQQTREQEFKTKIRQLENRVEDLQNEINGLKQNLEQRDQWASDSEKAKTEAERRWKVAEEMYLKLKRKYLVLEREKNERDVAEPLERERENKLVGELQREIVSLREQLNNARPDIAVNPQDAESVERDRENELVDDLQREIGSLREQLQNAHLMIQWQEQEFQGELQMLARGTAVGAVAAVPVDPIVNEVVPVQEGTDFAQGTYGLDSFNE